MSGLETAAMCHSCFTWRCFDWLLLVLHLHQVFPPRGIRHNPRLVVHNPNSGKITEEMMVIQQVCKEQAGPQDVSVEGGNEHNTRSSKTHQVLSHHDCYPSLEAEPVAAAGELELS